MRRQIGEPVRLHQIVAVDGGDDFRVRMGLGHRIVQRARLEARPFRQMEEFEVRAAERVDIGLDRLPDRIVLGVVSMIRTSKSGYCSRSSAWMVSIIISGGSL